MPVTLNFSPARADICIPRDTDWGFVATLTGSNGTPLNLTGATVAAKVYNTSGTAVATLPTTVIAPTTGQVNVEISRATTVSLTGKGYTWDLQVTDSADDRRKYLAGNFAVPQSWAGGGANFTAVTSSGVVLATLTTPNTINVVTIGIQGGDSSGIIAEVPFSYDVVTTFPIVTIAANTRVYRSAILITTAFNDAAAALTIGDSGDTDRLMTAPQNSPSSVGLYESHPGYLYSSSTAVNLYVSPGSSTQGAGVVYLFKN